jgi:hypothetical protein
MGRADIHLAVGTLSTKRATRAFSGKLQKRKGTTNRIPFPFFSAVIYVTDFLRVLRRLAPPGDISVYCATRASFRHERVAVPFTPHIISSSCCSVAAGEDPPTSPYSQFEDPMDYGNENKRI